MGTTNKAPLTGHADGCNYWKAGMKPCNCGYSEVLATVTDEEIAAARAITSGLTVGNAMDAAVRMRPEEKRCACGLTMAACAMDDCPSDCDPYA